MEMEPIVSLFSNLAVPVACLIATFYLWNKERERIINRSRRNSQRQLQTIPWLCRNLLTSWIRSNYGNRNGVLCPGIIFQV